MGAEFAHGAEDGEAAWGGGFGEGLQARDHGVGVGVVGIVEEVDAGEDFGFEATAGELSGVEGVCDGVWSHAEGPGHGGGESGIADHVAAEEGQGGVDTCAGEVEGEGGAGGRSDEVLSGDVATADAGGDDFGLAKAGDARGIGVVGVEDDVAGGGDVDGEGGFFPGDVFLGAEELDVGVSDVGEDGSVGAGDVDEGFDFASVIHAHLGDGAGVLVTEREEGEGEADVVVEIAFGGEEREVLGEDGGGEVLGGGFAVAAGESDDERVVPGAIGAGEVLQGEEGIGDLDDGAGDIRDGLADDES